MSRFPSVVQEVRDESGLTFEKLAGEIGVTVACIMRWKRDGHNLESVVALLRFSSSRRLPSSRKLARYLADACGARVRVTVR